MVLAFLFPAELVFEFARPEEAKNNSEKCLPPDSDAFKSVEF
jgi:hypothetical protein